MYPSRCISYVFFVVRTDAKLKIITLILPTVQRSSGLHRAELHPRRAEVAVFIFRELQRRRKGCDADKKA